MSQERTQLLGGLSRVVRRDPLAVPVVELAYPVADARRVRVSKGALVVEDLDGQVQATVPLEGQTLAELVAMLPGAAPGVTAILSDVTMGAVRAEALVDDERALGPVGVTLSAFTSPNWRLLDPVRAAIAAAAARLDAGVAQLNLLLAGGSFADLWGQLTATPRRRDEDDTTYTRRQLRELIRHRDNNQALAELIQQDAGVVVIAVRDLRPLVFQLSGGPLRGRPLAGRRYNANTCEVEIDGFPSIYVLELARAHVAAGITVFVRGTYVLADGRNDYHLTSSALRIGTPPPMVIGTGIIGVGQIGG